MSSKTRKKRGRQEISEEFPAAEQPLPLTSSSLPNDILWKIVLFSQDHSRLHLVSSSWNNGVIDAHCNPDCGCKDCTCTSTLDQFMAKRILLPWISKWNFTSYPFMRFPAALLTDMMFQKQQNGYETLRASSSFGNRGVVPITSVAVDVSDASFDNFLAVLVTAQVQHIKTLRITVFDFFRVTSFSPDHKKLGTEILGNLKEVENLQLSSWDFSYPGGQSHFRLLVNSFPHLKALTLRDCSIADTGLSVFATSSSVSGLTSLSIQANPNLAATAIRNSICASPYLTNLVHLDLSDIMCGDDAITAICQSRTLTAINTLVLSNCNLHDVSIQLMVTRAPASSPFLKNLVRLNIAENHISLDCAQNMAISSSTLLTEVSHVFGPVIQATMPQRDADLELIIGDANNFDRRAVEALTNIPFMKFVRTLTLTSSDEDATSVILSSSSRFVSLQNVTLITLWTSWFSLKVLTSSQFANNLRTLNLGTHSNHEEDDERFTEHLDDNCSAVIADSQSLHNLKSLIFGKPRMSVSNGLIRLLASPNLPALVHLDCDDQNHEAAAYESTEALSEDDAAQRIIDCLQSTSVGFRFPNTKFAANVKEKVQESLARSMTLESDSGMMLEM